MKFKLIKEQKYSKISPYKLLFGRYNFYSLNKEENIWLNKKLNQKEINNLIYLNEDNILYLEDEAILSLKEIVEKLKEMGKSNKIVLKISDKNSFNKFLLDKNISGYDNVVVYYDFVSYTLEKYIYFETLLYKIVEPSLNLTPFERYIYAYNIVKQFKNYKESKRRVLSRDLYFILENEYAVCVGFCEFLSDLLSKLDIPNIGFSIDGKDDEKDINWGHRRLYVNIKDEKYDINGFYVSDPTWDNDLDNDYYNHLVLTNEEAKLEVKFNYCNLYSEQNLFDFSNPRDIYLELINLDEKNEFRDILKIIKKFDLKYYNFLEKKYNTRNPNKKILKDLTMYIYNHLNNTISGDTIMDAVEVIYRHSYGYREEDLKEKLEEVRELNSNRQSCLFPSKIIKNNNGEEKFIILQNKFKKEENKIK